MPRQPKEFTDTLAGLFVGDVDFAHVLDQVVALAAETSAAQLVGITMLIDGRPATAAFNDPDVLELDHCQYEQDDGPCLTACRTLAPVHIVDVDQETRWPTFCDDAVAHGVRSVYAAPLNRGDRVVASLNIYARDPDAFSVDDIAAVNEFTSHAATVLDNARAYWDAYDTGEQLRAAMEFRSIIEQAKGILMAQSRVPETEAFDLLRRASQRENRKLREVAQDLVERTSAPES